MILSIGSSTGGINPISGSKLYWAVTVPKLLYGCEVWSMSEQSVLMMEQAHVWAARALQSLPNHSSCLAVTASLGWLSIESHIDIKRLCYVHRLICAEPRSIARKLTVHIFMQMYIDKDISTYEGPIAVLYKTCKKYNLMDIVYNELFFSATAMSSTRWKKCVYNSVSQQHIARWNMSRIMYTNLYLFNKCVKFVNCLWIWKVAERNQAF